MGGKISTTSRRSAGFEKSVEFDSSPRRLRWGGGWSG